MMIAVEGVDSSGKATQTKLLAEKLGGVRLAFPAYDQPAGKAILGHLKREWRTALNPDPEDAEITHEQLLEEVHLNALVFQCLQTVNRLELLPVINAVLASGKPLVCDRYSASATVYGTLDGRDPAWIELINASLPQPDLWILLDVPVEEGFKRRPERRDRIESNRAYLEKVREGYLKLFAEQARGDHYTSGYPWHIVDGLGTVDEVHERIMRIVRP